MPNHLLEVLYMLDCSLLVFYHRSSKRLNGIGASKQRFQIISLFSFEIISRSWNIFCSCYAPL